MRFLRYLLVQVLAYVVDIGGFVVFFSMFGSGPLVANTVGKILAGVLAFVLHRRYTFGLTGTGGQAAQAVRYLVLLGLNIPFSALVLAGAMTVIPEAVVAKLVSDVLCVALTYWLSGRLVFLRAGVPPDDLAGGRARR